MCFFFQTEVDFNATGVAALSTVEALQQEIAAVKVILILFI